MKCSVKPCLFALVTMGATSVPQGFAQTYTVGGAVYTDLANPITSGLEGVLVIVEGDGGTFEDSTAGLSGVWYVSDVPEGTYTVTPTLEGWCFKHVQDGEAGPSPPINIVVDADHESENLSIQFLADCAVCGDGTCDAGEDACGCPKDCGPPPDHEIPGVTCADGVDNDCDGLVDVEDPDCDDCGPFTIGGAIYADCDDPLGTGIEGGEVCVDCVGGFHACTLTSGTQGLWRLDDVPCGLCTVIPRLAGTGFCHMEADCPPVACVDMAEIEVNEANQAINLSIQFLLRVCPEATIVDTSPPPGVIDARQPHAHDSQLPRQGIGSPGAKGSKREAIRITLDPPVGGAENCFDLCETAEDPLWGPNSIGTGLDLGGGVYEIVLHHAITAGAVTTIEYKDGDDYVEYTSHPANVNADGLSGPVDILALIDCCLNNVCVPPWGTHSCDVDHSNLAAPPDILRVIDLLNGAAEFAIWNNTPLPINTSCP